MNQNTAKKKKKTAGFGASGAASPDGCPLRIRGARRFSIEARKLAGRRGGNDHARRCRRFRLALVQTAGLDDEARAGGNGRSAAHVRVVRFRRDVHVPGG